MHVYEGCRSAVKDRKISAFLGDAKNKKNK